jgi:hypothetical protein
MAEKFSQKTMLEMSQMDLPTDADIRKQVRELEGQARSIQSKAKAMIAQAQTNPQIQQMVQQNPQQAEETLAKLEEEAQQQIQQLQSQAEEVQKTVTIDQVMEFLRDNKIRPFVLDIETDSTIFPDEMAEKQARSEFLTAFGTAMQQIAPLVTAVPESASFAAEILRFALAPFRGGRTLDAAIDEFADNMIAKASQPQPPSPELLKVQQEAEYNNRKLAIEEQKIQLEMQKVQQAPQVEAQKEQIKAAANVQAKELDAQVAVAREEAQLAADTQTTQMSLEAEALLEQQRAAIEQAKFEADNEFRYVELDTDTRLAYDQLAVQQENARLAADAKANQSKPNGSGR